MQKRMLCLLLCLVCLAMLLQGCSPTPQEGEVGQDEVDDLSRTVSKAEVPDADNLPLLEDATVYAQDAPGSLVRFYATIREGSATNDAGHTFEEVNAFVFDEKEPNAAKPKAEVLLQEGDAYGPKPGGVGFLATVANGTIRMRGRSSTAAPQKSYRIDLFDGGELWRGQRAISLMKHPGDPSRIRNKLYFDLLKEIPHMTSLRTQFVQLYVKDETADPPQREFVDYGLYTFVETPNKRFLRNHGLSRHGDLYKANMFEFYRYPEQIRLKGDPLYDEEAFAAVIEPKGDGDHEKLIEMLDAVNDIFLPIEDVLEAYFDTDNILSFLAYNLLMGNPDFNSQNFFLYRPNNSNTWYFLPWDGDGSLHYGSDEILERSSSMGWQRGISSVWNMQLFNRMLRQREYRDRLLERVDELRLILTPERIAEQIETYRVVTDPFMERMPDTIHLRATLGEMEEIYAAMPGDIERSYEYILESMQLPMPFFLDDVVSVESGVYELRWGEAYSFDGSVVQYDVEVASDRGFVADRILESHYGLTVLELQIDALPPGTYWWRVTARNAHGSQTAFDAISSPDGFIPGLRSFYVQADGQVVNGE